MKEFDEGIPGNKVFLAEKYRPGKLALADITADSSDIFVKEFGDLAGCMEVEIDGHLKRTPSPFSCMNTTLFNDPPNLIGGDIYPTSDSDDVFDYLVLSPVMERHKAYLEESGELLAREERVGFGVHCSPMNFLILYRVLSWGFEVLPLRISATAECDILRNTPICWRV